MPERTTREQAMRTAGVIAGGIASANTVFWFLSDLYFDSHKLTGDIFDAVGLRGARLAFFVLSAVVGSAVFAAALAPRVIGHVLASLIGLASIAAAIGAFVGGLPAVVGCFLLVVGGLMPMLAWKSWHHSRAAWAFLIAMVVVCGGCDFFGATKVRGVLGVGLWTALIFPALQFVTVAALAMIRGEYREAT